MKERTEYEVVSGQLRRTAYSNAPPGSLEVDHPRSLLQRTVADSARLRAVAAVMGRERGAKTLDSVIDAISNILKRPEDPVDLEFLDLDRPSLWPFGALAVPFRVSNRMAIPISGFVQGAVHQGIARRFTGPWDQASARFAMLAPGASWEGEFVFSHWLGTPTVGQGDLTLMLYCEEMEGSISIVTRDPFGGDQTVHTYGIGAIASDQVELYPSCSPAGPDFITIDRFTAVPSEVLLSADGAFVQDGQQVSLDWEVRSGGYPAFGLHGGSVASTVITGPTLAAPISVPPAGPQVFAIGGLPAARLGEAFTLHTEGNCGAQDRQLHLRGRLPTPYIESFEVVEVNVYLEELVRVKWVVRDCAGCEISLFGSSLPNGPRKLLETGYPADSSTAFPITDSFELIFEVRGNGWVDTRKQWIQLIVPNTPDRPLARYHYKMESDIHPENPCFGWAVIWYADEPDVAKARVEQLHPDYTATEMDEADFGDPCG